MPLPRIQLLGRKKRSVDRGYAFQLAEVTTTSFARLGALNLGRQIQQSAQPRGSNFLP